MPSKKLSNEIKQKYKLTREKENGMYILSGHIKD